MWWKVGTGTPSVVVSPSTPPTGSCVNALRRRGAAERGKREPHHRERCQASISTCHGTCRLRRWQHAERRWTGARAKIHVDVGQVLLVRKQLLRVGRHRAPRRPDVPHERREGHRLGAKLRSTEPSLRLDAMTRVASVCHEEVLTPLEVALRSRGRRLFAAHGLARLTCDQSSVRDLPPYLRSEAIHGDRGRAPRSGGGGSRALASSRGGSGTGGGPLPAPRTRPRQQRRSS